MGSLKPRIIELLPGAQNSDETARLHLLGLSLDVNHKGVPENLGAAADYRLRGWSIVPQLPGAKQPCVKWKPFQTRLPTVDEMVAWWTRWPEAGIAVALGPISKHFAVDVDGEEAHAALLKHLSGAPKAPRSLSGSGKPFRYHLFFKHPPVNTGAKFCPWCPTLEFRGQGGIVVLPPSRHKSGGQYRWADGASIDETDLPNVPAAILRELQARGRRRASIPASPMPTTSSTSPRLGLARQIVNFNSLNSETRRFLYGMYAEGPDWNCRLFRAACDLAGNGINKETATRLLLAGAEPWNAEETQRALATIESAYSERRYPAEQGKKRAPRRGPKTRKGT